MKSSTRELRRTLNKKLEAYRSAKERASRERKALKQLERREDAMLEAQLLAQRVAQKIQSRAHASIAAIVTKCLGIFDEPYEFRIEFARKRGRTSAQLLFLKDGHEVDPLTASGGGVVDVAAFALRVACLVLARPKLRRLLVLDEPFKHLSRDYRVRARQMLEGLAEELGIQFVMVTHDPRLQSGKVLDLSD